VLDLSPFSSTEVASDQGLRGAFYALDSGAAGLPDDLDSRKPQANLRAAVLNVAPTAFTSGFPGPSGPVTTYFALRYTGQINVTQAGLTDFSLLSDAGARLLIDGQVVADDMGKASLQGATGTADLTAGKHAIQVDYFHDAGSQVELRLYWTPPGSLEAVVPAGALSPTK
jgi:hypothetical protein